MGDGNMSGMYDGLLDGEPILMPYQALPLNGDTFACEEFLSFKRLFNIKTLIELGSCVFGSTNWFADNFDFVKTVEINPEFRNIGLKRISGKTNVESLLGDSIDLLPFMLQGCGNDTLIFIDSHWQTLPLLQELEIIANSGIKPCIVVHDCFVPNEPSLGFDEYNGVAISHDTMQPILSKIYGEDGYGYYYNSDEESTEVKRGIIYIYPFIS